jgi:hypothetical protein
MRRRGDNNRRSAPEWPRRKMLALLFGVGLGAVVLLCGLILAVIYAVHPNHHSGRGHPTTADAAISKGVKQGSAASRAASTSERATDARDALANQPMPSVDEDASHPGPVSAAATGPSITLPLATATGPAHVPTGFPRSPTGAMAQLAAIDQVAIQSGSLDIARAVINGWAVPGGPTGSTWSRVEALVTLFNAAGLSGGGSPQLALVLTPLMGQIKGSVGNDFVVPCVDFELEVTLQQTARGATADCQRMVWQPDPPGPGGGGGRWEIGAGPEPATPPSVWPDTELAIRVGYHDLRQEHR